MIFSLLICTGALLYAANAQGNLLTDCFNKQSPCSVDDSQFPPYNTFLATTEDSCKSACITQNDKGILVSNQGKLEIKFCKLAVFKGGVCKLYYQDGISLGSGGSSGSSGSGNYQGRFARQAGYVLPPGNPPTGGYGGQSPPVAPPPAGGYGGQSPPVAPPPAGGYGGQSPPIAPPPVGGYGGQSPPVAPPPVGGYGGQSAPVAPAQGGYGGEQQTGYGGQSGAAPPALGGYGGQSGDQWGGQPSGGYGGSQTSGGYGGSQTSGGYGGSQTSGGYGGSQPSGGYGGSQPSGGYGGSQPSGGYGGNQPNGGGNQPSNGPATCYQVKALCAGSGSNATGGTTAAPNATGADCFLPKANKQLDGNAYKYLQAPADFDGTAADCKKKCEADAKCLSINFYAAVGDATTDPAQCVLHDLKCSDATNPAVVCEDRNDTEYYEKGPSCKAA